MQKAFELAKTIFPDNELWFYDLDSVSGGAASSPKNEKITAADKTVIGMTVAEFLSQHRQAWKSGLLILNSTRTNC